MSKTSKSPLAVAMAAMRVACRALPPYSHRFSPKKFSQPQLFAVITLKVFFKTDFRGITKLLCDMPSLRRAIKLKTVPHYTTIHKAFTRLLTASASLNLLHTTARIALGNRTHVELAAIDSTGLESGHISPYFIKRRSQCLKTRQNTQLTPCPKMAIIAETEKHVVLSVFTTHGPSSDSGHFRDAVALLPPEMKIKKLLADAGYDSEASHQWANEVCGIKTVIPPKIGTPTASLPKKPYRRQMATNFDSKSYRRRWQVETVFSMIKRNLGYATRSRLEYNRSSEMYMLAITHNLMVIYLLMSFSTEQKFTISGQRRYRRWLPSRRIWRGSLL